MTRAPRLASWRRRVLCLVVVATLVPLAGCFGSAEDDDGLPSEVERDGWDIRIVMPDGQQVTRSVDSDPSVDDTDGDGQDDAVEFLEGTDPRSVDTDEDGLLDGEDVVLAPDDPRVAAWKALGIEPIERDDDLVFLGERGEKDSSSGRGGEPADADTDDDGILDGVEAYGFEMTFDGVTVLVQTAVWNQDTDGDRLEDGFERDFQTKPHERDTDGDGVADGVDLDPFRDIRLSIVVRSLELGGAYADGRGHDIFLRFTQVVPEGVTTPTARITGTADADALDRLSTDGLDPRDTGGDVMAGRHDLRAHLYAVTLDGGRERLLDLFSDDSGSTDLPLVYHAMNDTLALAGQEGDAEGAVIETSGADGAITIEFQRPDAA